MLPSLPQLLSAHMDPQESSFGEEIAEAERCVVQYLAKVSIVYELKGPLMTEPIVQAAGTINSAAVRTRACERDFHLLACPHSA